MRIGLPQEIKNYEFRVALTPSAVQTLVNAGHEVWVQTKAGQGSGFSDALYRLAGAKITKKASQVWRQELVIKVKEPLPQEYQYFRPGLILFTYLHLAAEPQLLSSLLKRKVTALGYETVRNIQGELPLLRPMSLIAGQLAAFIGADLLRKDHGQQGILLSKVMGAVPSRVLILGAGSAGQGAVSIAAAVGAEVYLVDQNLDRLKKLKEQYPSIITELNTSQILEKLTSQADLMIGGVLIPGKKAPKLVSRSMVKEMQPGSVIVDVAIDQGGCVETSRVTSHSRPTFISEKVIHYGVPNMPALVSRTATEALVAATLPYIKKLADHGLQALEQDVGFKQGLQTLDGIFLLE